MRITVIQKDINALDIKPYLEEARARNSDIACFGELAVSGCLYTPRKVPELEHTIETFSPYDFGIMAGVPELGTEGLYNSYLYCHQEACRIYRKINLFPPFDEPAVFLPGTKPGFWQTEFGRVGVAICYDIRFDKIFQDLKALSVGKIFIPAAFPLARIQDWRDLLIQRARETSTYIIGINSVGDDGHNVFGGNSTVVDPYGEVLAEADQKSESFLKIDIPE